MLNLSRLRTSVLGVVGASALVLAASPAWAGQINLLQTTTITTTSQTSLNTSVNTSANTALNTLTNTALNTSLNTISLTLGGAQGLNSVVRTTVNTSARTTLNTSANTSANTALNTSINTLNQTILETVSYAGQPADVSIEVTESGLNVGSPFDNSLSALELINNVDATGTSGVTQIQQSTGVGNVIVGTNSILDGITLSDLAASGNTGMVASEIAGITLNPGAIALSPKNQMVTLIGKEALIAAVESHTGDVETYDASANTGESASITAAVDIVLEDVNENSPHGNSATIVGAVTNNATVVGTTGINQIQQAAGVSNVHSSSNVIVVDVSNLANGAAFSFNE